jgi:long-subunit fatty acid transport protein
MKRSLTTAVAALFISGSLLAGGIVTNTNHSAMYTRLGNRAATLGIDAVYYNPAGLTKLGNGFHFSINNQVIGQTRTVITDYDPVLNFREPSNNGEFVGEVSAPFFPGIYGVFKIGKWAFSAGFNPVGGGGGATYNHGLPSFEYPVSDLIPALGSPSYTKYKLDALFEGTSVFFGYQANVSYAINDMISVAIGGRYVTAKETYSGHLQDIQIGDGTNWIDAPDYFNAAAASATGAANALQPAIDGGMGDAPIEALGNQDIIDALTAAGQYTPGMSVSLSQQAFQGIAATSTGFATVLSDQDVDAEKTGSGFTPIVSVNIQPIDMLNVAVKYEHSTKLELTTSSPAGKNGLIGIDDNNNPEYMFTDGAKDRLDMPALLAFGVTLRPIEPLLIAGNFTTYFDKNVVWGTEEANRTEQLSGNFWDAGLGAEFSLSEKFLVSAGWGMTSTGATPEYQTDLSYSLSTQSVSFGFAWDILPIVQLNVGLHLVNYQDGDRTFDHEFPGTETLFPITEQLQKNVWVVGAGLNIRLASED